MKKLFLLAALLFMCAAPSMAVDAFQETAMPQDALLSGAITVKGEGASPQGLFTQAQKRIMALRAAKAVAFREAAEILDGVTLTGDTTVLNASASSDVVRASVEGVIRGAVVLSEEYDPETGAASVFLSVPMGAVAASILPQMSSISPGASMYNTSMNATTARYDGLVVDARGTGLRPALMNRLVTAGGEVVYDPSKASQKALSEYGPAAYTNDVAKAKALLAKRGSSQPLVVKARGTASSTDAELGPIEAGAVFFSNQHTGFLQAARVVFVLD